MKKVSVSQLKGGEILSRDLYTANYTILMAKGTTLKKEYIEKFPLLGIASVYIQNDMSIKGGQSESAMDFVREELKEECNIKVRQVLERHIYRHNKELENLCTVAEELIHDIIEEEKIQEIVVEVREEGRDLYSHSVNVCGLSTLLALKMGISKEVTAEIARGSILHDVGLRYITLPYENVEIDKLALHDQLEYKKHAMLGFEALSKEKWLSQTTKDIILFHHEMEDGSGYPLHTKGDKLSLPTKIVILCEAFDEMISGIGCKRTKIQEVVEYLKYHKGIRYDREVTDTFLKMIIQYPIGSLVMTNEGEIGKVIRQNKEMTERPVLLITVDKLGKELEKPRELDLCKVLNVFIDKTLD